MGPDFAPIKMSYWEPTGYVLVTPEEVSHLGELNRNVRFSARDFADIPVAYDDSVVAVCLSFLGSYALRLAQMML